MAESNTDTDTGAGRGFFKMTLNVEIYYRQYETREEYSKMTTIDLSAEGFKCRSEKHIEKDALLDCMIVVWPEALPVTVRVSGSEPAEDKYGNRIYEVSALFHKIGDTIRERLVRYLFLQQRKKQAELHGRKFKINNIL